MAERLKDQFFQRPFFDALTRRLKQAYPSFDSRRFFRLLHDEEWEDRELKARMRHASETLGQTLPDDYRKALRILLKVERHFEGFDHLLFSDFVERFGVDDYDASIPALEVFTRSSSEFAIRPFIRRYPKKTMAQMRRWARHRDEKVRRLSSEGCRPRLPWGAALEEFKRDPSPILPILEILKDDPSETVTRSVANNLNDIARDNPGVALDLAARWLEESPSRKALLKHALRGLLKKGEPRALALFDVETGARVRVTKLAVTPRRVPLGGRCVMSAAAVSDEAKRRTVRLEYVITYARAGGRTGRKVFQLREVELDPGERLELTRNLSFADRSTRKHYPGPHTLALVVNGERKKATRFSLVEE
jgi:3-methyladenine DNA glycosylase AlkC